MLKKNDIIDLEIISLTFDGSGVGRYEKMAVFVPNTAVGDVLKVKIVKVLKSYAFGIIDSIVLSSADRIIPECEVNGKCGGCAFGHINYEAELCCKQQYVKDCFERLGKIKTDFEEILPCDKTFGYRNKAQYPVGIVDGKAVCGFYAKRSHRIVAFDECSLQPKIFSEITRDIINYINYKQISVYNEKTNSGIIRHIYLRKAEHTDEIGVTLVVTKKYKFEELIKLLTEKYPTIKSIVLNINSKDTNVILGNQCIIVFGNDTIEDIMCGNKISISPLSFYQVNTLQAEKLYSVAREYADLSKDDVLIDMYCGAGTIGLSMARDVKQVIGTEIIEAAVKNAKKNAENNGINNAEFLCGDAAKTAEILKNKGVQANIIMLDPPRKGCDEDLIKTVSEMNPDRVVMISCNPATAARDCARFEENGYKVIKARAVDMFPRTSHVEVVVLLIKGGMTNE